MQGRRISSGSKFEELAGYSRAVVLPDPGGDWVLVSGTTGYDYATGTISDDVAEQTRQVFRNIERALAEAGASLKDVVRSTVIFPDPDDFFDHIVPVLKEYLGEALPTSTAFVAPLVRDEIRVEIEVTARKAPGA